MATDTNKRRNIKHARCVTLDDVSLAILKNIGRGNISRGIRVAARHFSDSSTLSGARLLTEAISIKNYKVLRNGFDSRKLHTYTEARVNGKWFRVSHFDDEHTHVWLRSDHGVQSGFVEIDSIEEWKAASNW